MEMRLAPQRRRRQQRRRRYTIIGVIVIILILVVGYFAAVNHPMSQARSNLTHSAKQAKQIRYVDHFYHVSNQHTYYALTGRNQDNQPVGVIQRKGSKKLTTVKLNHGLSAKDIRQSVKQNYQVKKITSLGLATYHNIPAWDVTFIDKQNNMNYVTYRFSDGKVLRSILNL
ncbi:uncharacterized protein YpmB [Weissella uvarum]|uniref:cell wall elongation regulator TseB-like domain-containing protein n=1 Tax=Weissella uvarum TaxID=1479233 RepID=UPI00196213EA|nr:DUF5590 domain-containing protein [Weissella uvarum]MBM7617459.1 uncharacterized protein YpmB [Weissella uvarum]MCM0595656.1 hypothetical protein [Weissella uvarum]